MITRAGVVGCGLMGAGIAAVCARAGLGVIIAESSVTTAEIRRTRLEKSLICGEERVRIDSATAVLDRIRGVAPPPLLARIVDAALLGRKTGRGFHTYV